MQPVRGLFYYVKLQYYIEAIIRNIYNISTACPTIFPARSCWQIRQIRLLLSRVSNCLSDGHLLTAR